MTRPKKSLGQNFLVDKNVVARIVKSVAAGPGDAVIEIGPGRGALTRRLVADGGFVLAVEIDRDLAEEIGRSITSPNFRLIVGDALKLDWAQVIDTAVTSWRGFYRSVETPRLRVVANLPYYISTAIIQELMRYSRSLFDLTLMLQREVVERITSEPGGREYGFMTVLVRYYCEATRLFDVKPGSFVPPPKVWSSVMRLVPRDSPAVVVSDEQGFFSLIRAAFAQRRKTILNNLKGWVTGGLTEQDVRTALGLCGIDPRRRAETLSISEFAQLFETLRHRREALSLDAMP